MNTFLKIQSKHLFSGSHFFDCYGFNIARVLKPEIHNSTKVKLFSKQQLLFIFK